MTDTARVKNAEQFNRRECFADTSDGMNAWLAFADLLEAAAPKAEAVKEAEPAKETAAEPEKAAE